MERDAVVFQYCDEPSDARRAGNVTLRPFAAGNRGQRSPLSLRCQVDANKSSSVLVFISLHDRTHLSSLAAFPRAGLER